MDASTMKEIAARLERAERDRVASIRRRRR
jgi:hypothetical protein